jgi:hypothetical protein
MALIVYLRNITGLADVSDYEAEVYVNYNRIYASTVKGHKRADGWQALLKKLAEEAECESKPRN